MQRGEATLPTAAPSQTCPSCCASLPTGIPQQPRLSRRQCPVRSSLVPAVPGGRCLFPPQHLLLLLGLVEWGLLGTGWVLCNTALTREKSTGGWLKPAGLLVSWFRFFF